MGTVKRSPDGFGFLIPEDPSHPDVYLPRHTMTSIMTSDRVEVEVHRERGDQRLRGEITQVLQRGTTEVVGKISIKPNGEAILRDEAQAWGRDLKIKSADTLGAKSDQLVIATVTHYPTSSNPDFFGKIKEVLGHHQDPLLDIRRVLIAQAIPDRFSKEALTEAEKFPREVTNEQIRSRRDLRSLSFVTIDGATAKDFDDAICVANDPKGFRLWVAIADVSTYVRTGTSIDKDAYERGTSVYFPNFVVPMLPEALSNHLCSLMPKVPRLALVCEMLCNFEGDTIHSEFYEATIESKARITYGEAQEVIDGGRIDSFEPLREDLLRARDLAKVLMARRFRHGSLDLEIPETQVLVNSAGEPVDILRSERLFAHRLIEELMLAANVAAALFLEKDNGYGIFRIHDQPKAEALEILERYLTSFGGRMHGSSSGKAGLQKRLTKVLQSFEGKPESLVLNILTLRSMNQAKYSTQNIGHFGLAFDHYTHFTSPIRRYPDLLVHRLIKSKIARAQPDMSEADLASAAQWLSACEQRSVKAERNLVSIKKARFMSLRVGEEFAGMISSVTRFGVFVLLRSFEVDGLLRSEDLSPEKLEFDEEHLRLTSRRSGASFAIGDTLEVRVSAVDVEAGQISFVRADAPVGAVTAPARQGRFYGRPHSTSKQNRNDTENRKKGGKPERNKRGKKFENSRSTEEKTHDKNQKRATTKPSKFSRDAESGNPDSYPRKLNARKSEFTSKPKPGAGSRPTRPLQEPKPTPSNSAAGTGPKRSVRELILAGEYPGFQKSTGSTDTNNKSANLSKSSDRKERGPQKERSGFKTSYSGAKPSRGSSRGSKRRRK